MKQFSTTPTGPGQRFFPQLHQYLAALLLLLLAAPLARAQAPAWQTAVGLGGVGASIINATAADASGNVYVTGGFSGTVVLGGTTLTSAGLRDVFVAKWSPATGSFVWAQRAGGTGEEYANGIAVSGSSVYLIGVFGSTQVAFGTTTLVNAGASPTGLNYDGYVAKLTDAGGSGSFVWAQGFGGSDREFGNAIGVSGTNVYIAGLFYSASAAFGPIALANSAPTASPATTDVYMARLVDAGATSSFSWAEHTGSAGSEYCSDLAVSGSSIYLTGSFTGATVSLGTLALANSTPGPEDIFVTKITDQGTAPRFEWAQRAGGTGTDQALRITANSNGVYIMGRFSGSAMASTTSTFGSTVLANAGLTDVFVAKLSDAGSTAGFVWAQQLGGSGYDSAYGLAVRGNSVYVAGNFQGTATFGPTSFTSRGGDDVFVARLADAGPTAQVVWAQQAGGTGNDDGYGALIVGSSVYVGGNIGLPATFGSLTVAGSAGTQAGFLASITDLVGLATTPAGPLAGTSLYPNPAHATATVQLPPVPGASSATLTITDALGRVVRTVTVALPAAGLRHALDLAGLPAGLYAVRVAAGDRSATHRLVVE